MIYHYAIELTGKSHILEEKPCQDAYKVIPLENGVVIAAVADGLGSESHSGMASELAVKVSTEHIAEKMGSLKKGDPLPDNTDEIIHDAYTIAQDSIEAESVKQEVDLSQCDTTLSVAVFANSELYYGQSGDSGIIALLNDGRYVSVTEQQRDDEGRVFPLFFREQKWVFGKMDVPVSSVLLATDGIYDTFSPIYIKDCDPSLHVSVLQYFMDKDVLNYEEQGQEKIETERGTYIESVPKEIIDDDTTLVVLVDPDVSVTPQPDSYYAEPDWDTIRTAWKENYKEKAYPELKLEEKDED